MEKQEFAQVLAFALSAPEIACIEKVNSLEDAHDNKALVVRLKDNSEFVILLIDVSDTVAGRR